MFKGSNVALITPFKDNGLDEEAYIKLIHFHMDNGTSGLVPLELLESPRHLVIKNIKELLIYV